MPIVPDFMLEGARERLREKWLASRYTPRWVRRGIGRRWLTQNIDNAAKWKGGNQYKGGKILKAKGLRRQYIKSRWIERMAEYQAWLKEHSGIYMWFQHWLQPELRDRALRGEAIGKVILDDYLNKEAK